MTTSFIYIKDPVLKNYGQKNKIKFDSEGLLMVISDGKLKRYADGNEIPEVLDQLTSLIIMDQYNDVTKEKNFHDIINAVPQKAIQNSQRLGDNSFDAKLEEFLESQNPKNNISGNKMPVFENSEKSVEPEIEFKDDDFNIDDDLALSLSDLFEQPPVTEQNSEVSTSENHEEHVQEKTPGSHSKERSESEIQDKYHEENWQKYLNVDPKDEKENEGAQGQNSVQEENINVLPDHISGKNAIEHQDNKSKVVRAQIYELPINEANLTKPHAHLTIGQLEIQITHSKVEIEKLNQKIKLEEEHLSLLNDALKKKEGDAQKALQFNNIIEEAVLNATPEKIDDIVSSLIKKLNTL